MPNDINYQLIAGLVALLAAGAVALRAWAGKQDREDKQQPWAYEGAPSAVFQVARDIVEELRNLVRVIESFRDQPPPPRRRSRKRP